MDIKKTFSLNKVRDVLAKVMNDPSYTLEEKILIYRFRDKLTDTESFELRVNREFSAIQLKTEKDGVDKAIWERTPIYLPCGFYLKPVQETNWELYLNDEIFLKQLDQKIARRIALDINVAFSIKAAQLSRQ